MFFLLSSRRYLWNCTDKPTCQAVKCQARRFTLFSQPICNSNANALWKMFLKVYRNSKFARDAHIKHAHSNDEYAAGSHSYETLSGVCSRRLSFFGHLYHADLWQDHHRALQACTSGLPDNEDGGLVVEAILAQNRGGRPATNESWTGDREATHSGPIRLAESRGNGYVVLDALLKRQSDAFKLYHSKYFMYVLVIFSVFRNKCCCQYVV